MKEMLDVAMSVVKNQGLDAIMDGSEVSIISNMLKVKLEISEEGSILFLLLPSVGKNELVVEPMVRFKNGRVKLHEKRMLLSNLVFGEKMNATEKLVMININENLNKFIPLDCSTYFYLSKASDDRVRIKITCTSNSTQEDLINDFLMDSIKSIANLS